MIFPNAMRFDMPVPHERKLLYFKWKFRRIPLQFGIIRMLLVSLFIQHCFCLCLSFVYESAEVPWDAQRVGQEIWCIMKCLIPYRSLSLKGSYGYTIMIIWIHYLRHIYASIIPLPYFIISLDGTVSTVYHYLLMCSLLSVFLIFVD